MNEYSIYNIIIEKYSEVFFKRNNKKLDYNFSNDLTNFVKNNYDYFTLIETKLELCNNSLFSKNELDTAFEKLDPSIKTSIPNNASSMFTESEPEGFSFDSSKYPWINSSVLHGI